MGRTCNSYFSGTNIELDEEYFILEREWGRNECGASSKNELMNSKKSLIITEFVPCGLNSF